MAVLLGEHHYGGGLHDSHTRLLKGKTPLISRETLPFRNQMCPEPREIELAAVSCICHNGLDGRYPPGFRVKGSTMQRELELKVELSNSDVVRLAGELSVGDLSVGPAAA